MAVGGRDGHHRVLGCLSGVLIFPRLTSRLLPEAEGNSRTQPVPPRPHTAMTWFYPRQKAARSPRLGQKRQRQGTVSESRGCWEAVKRQDHGYKGGGWGGSTGPSDISDKAHMPITSHYRCPDVDHRAGDSRAQHPSKHGALGDCPGRTPAMLPRPWGGQALQVDTHPLTHMVVHECLTRPYAPHP